MNKSIIKISRTLISVYDKTGIVDFAQFLSDRNVEILSTGGTAKKLREAGIKVIDVSDYTGFPEIMGGRVKTINPLVEGGILGLRDTHKAEAEQHNIKWIDLVVCNLYPFAETIRKPNVRFDDVLKNIDIGGPTMIRSAAKNIGWVSVVVDPIDYQLIINEVDTKEGISFDVRKLLAAKAFGHSAQYDTIIHNHLKEETLTELLSLTFDKSYDLRYGENPHQRAAVYKAPIRTKPNIVDTKIHQGKKLSYNNLMDADAALACLREFTEPTCVVVKHGNPCGVASGENIIDVYNRAFNADSKSAFGGIIALNHTCTKAVAEEIKKVFVEIVIAPDYENSAIEIFSKKKNLRVLEIGKITPKAATTEFRYINGGLLVQESDVSVITLDDLKIVTKTKPSANDMETMLFAWKVLKHVKSNAILTARDNTTLGIGAGQVSRIDSVDIAIRKSGNDLNGAVLASDAFFPFRDSIDMIAATGVKTIIQPGGSIRDQEVINACDEHGIAMIFTGTRCFKH